jgi:DtxR family transcriptional regulator, Mn-dependent transcriptional regulator
MRFPRGMVTGSDGLARFRLNPVSCGLVATRVRGSVNTESVDDYLKAILELSGPEEKRVVSNALARQLGVRAASVTGMVKKLAAQRPSFVKYQKRHGVRLTRTGKMRALEVLRHHRLLERFLHDCLGYTWDEVHEEAERLEHFISERLEDRIAAKLSDPQTDPHGHLIPERSGAIPRRQEMPLSKWACGVRAVISSVSDRDPSRLREMERLGLRPGVSITVDAGIRNASLLVRIDGHPSAVRLSQELTNGISVIPDGSVATDESTPPR